MKTDQNYAEGSHKLVLCKCAGSPRLDFRVSLGITGANLGALNDDIEFPSVVQRRLLWYSATSRLNNGVVNDGVILEMNKKVIRACPSKRPSSSLPHTYTCQDTSF